MAAHQGRKLIDIAVNLTDSMFKGIYHGKQAHSNDYSTILERAFKQGIDKIMITGGNLEESREALNMARTHPQLFSTVGVHPTRCQEFVGKEEEHFKGLKELLNEGKDKIVAVGEFGLDYDRIQFCTPEVQREYFEKQFALAEESKLPLFLHMRDAAQDFIDIISKNRHKFTKGVVHSFTGTSEEAMKIIDLDLFIGFNGCSLKTEQNLEVVKNVPVERIMIETDAPWCDIRSTHAGFKHVKTTFQSKDKKKWQVDNTVKGRNEPCNLVQVLEVIAGVKGMDIDQLAEIVYKNTCSVFFPNQQ